MIVIVLADLDVIVIAPLIVAALVNRNDTVGVIHAVDCSQTHMPAKETRP